MRITNKFVLLPLLLAHMLSLGCTTQQFSPEGTTTTVILIRHAERTSDTKLLTPFGKTRAAALPAAVADYDISAIYSPDLARNIDTVKPLAKQRRLKITLVDANPDVELITRRLLNDHPGKTVLWVGNTTNLDRIYADLGGDGKAPTVYGDLFILRVPDRGFSRVSKLVFGD